MLIWVFKLTEPSPWDAAHDGSRKFRCSFLAEALLDAGHEVVWWTDDFRHLRKDLGHRFGEDHTEEVLPGLTMRWTHTPGYSRNVSLRRFRDHAICATKMEAEAEDWPRPDLIFSCMPSDALCDLAVRLGKRWKIPTILDVRDLWPDVFFEGHVSRLLNPIVWLLTRSMARRVRRAFAGATAVVGNTPEFMQWGRRKAGLDPGPLDCGDFPIGYQRFQIDDIQRAQAEAFWAQHNVRPGDGKFRAAFLGSFTFMVDLETVVAAARRTPDVQFVLCGNGPLLEGFHGSTADLDNVVLPGRIGAAQIKVLLESSAVGISPYIDTPNFRVNLSNKPAEYLSFSLPILSAIPGRVADLLAEYDCGGVYSNTDSLVRLLNAYRQAPATLASATAGATRLFTDVFDAETIYVRMAQHVEHVSREFAPARQGPGPRVTTGL